MANIPIPPVDPEDIKRMWEYEKDHSLKGSNACEWTKDMRGTCLASESDAAFSRYDMIQTMIRMHGVQLLAPWQHGQDLDDAVFRVAATIPLHTIRHWDYSIPGDEHYGFDPNAFVQRLIDETGIQHTWETVQVKVPEGQRNWAMSIDGPDSEAREARGLLWAIWSRFSRDAELIKDIPQISQESACEFVATSFADFLIDNLELVQQVKNQAMGDSIPLLEELERKAASSSRFPHL